MDKFSINVRVYYEDTDAGGIVYHANYLKFCERARTDWLRHVGLTQHKMLEQKIGFVVSSLRCRFRKAAKLDDLLTVSCEVIKVRKVAITFYQRVTLEDGTLLFELECDVANVDLAKGSVRALDNTTITLAQDALVDDPNLGVK